MKDHTMVWLGMLIFMLLTFATAMAVAELLTVAFKAVL